MAESFLTFLSTLVPKGDTAHPDAGAPALGGRGLRLDFMSALKHRPRWPYNSPFRQNSHLNLETTHGSLVPAVSPPSAHLLTPSRHSVLPSEDEDEAGASASSGQARLRGPAQEPPPPPRTPGAGRGDSILLFTLGTRIFGVYFLSLQKNGSLAFQITPFYLETLESQDLCVGFIWRKETTWFCLFSLFAFRLWED